MKRFSHTAIIRLLLAVSLGLGALWTWRGTPPPLVSANAPDSLVARTRTAAEAAGAARRSAVEAISDLEGPQGDFERRGNALRSASVADRPALAQAIASDIVRFAEASRRSEQERAALQEYDAALMARTRDLGPRAEDLRPATWPIVEQLKLYPPPLGLRSDWAPPTSDFFATRAISIETGTLEQQAAAATEVGRATYAARQLRELDAAYRAELERYAATLQTTIDARAAPPTPLRLTLALLITAGLVALLLLALAPLVEPLEWPWWLPWLGLALWFGLPWPLAGAGALLIVAGVALRPGAAALLPLAAVPLYYRPRAVLTLRFPLNETLVGLLLAGLALHGLWRRRWPRLNWRRLRPLLGLGGLLLAAGLLSLLSPELVDSRVALRELRRTLAEPLLWAGLALLLLERQHIRPLSLLWTFIGMAALIASDGLIRFALGQGIWATSSVPRLIGLLPGSTALGVYLGAALAGAGALSLDLRGQQRRSAILLTLPLLGGVLLTFTRGAWIGVLLLAALALLLRKRWRWLAAGAGAGAIGLGALLAISPALLARGLRLGEGTGTARQEIWVAALRAIRDQPLLGLGMDQFAHVDPQRFGIPQIRFLTLAHPHNIVLDAWLQLGLLGLLTVAGMVALIGWRSWRARHTLLGLATLAIGGELLIHGMLDQTMLGGDMLYVWLMLFVLALDLPGEAPALEPPAA